MERQYPPLYRAQGPGKEITGNSDGIFPRGRDSFPRKDSADTDERGMTGEMAMPRIVAFRETVPRKKSHSPPTRGSNPRDAMHLLLVYLQMGVIILDQTVIGHRRAVADGHGR